jgi:hypothetical protein
MLGSLLIQGVFVLGSLVVLVITAQQGSWAASGIIFLCCIYIARNLALDVPEFFRQTNQRQLRKELSRRITEILGLDNDRTLSFEDKTLYFSRSNRELRVDVASEGDIFEERMLNPERVIIPVSRYSVYRIHPIVHFQVIPFEVIDDEMGMRFQPLREKVSRLTGFKSYKKLSESGFFIAPEDQIETLIEWIDSGE